MSRKEVVSGGVWSGTERKAPESPLERTAQRTLATGDRISESFGVFFCPIPVHFFLHSALSGFSDSLGEILLQKNNRPIRPNMERTK